METQRVRLTTGFMALTSDDMRHVQVPDVNKRAVYMCGPVGFMEDMEGALRTLNGGQRADVYKESFDY